MIVALKYVFTSCSPDYFGRRGMKQSYFSLLSLKQWILLASNCLWERYF